ncbi:MAG: hypothetical protein PHE32_00340 [Candidatus Shapirobacteria bacterium]|nr:hypothetical protein [Candidatus Shapirobacteria bacterium]MDD4410146.1 hypothetical protein [Candidatus Shapirobacteria bacterium]
MNLKKIIIFIVFCFAGYSIGRIGHVFGGFLITPHHWIYGLLIFGLGWFLRKKKIGNILMAFGTGVFISDLKDFFYFRIYGQDINETFRFWGLD